MREKGKEQGTKPEEGEEEEKKPLSTRYVAGVISP